MNLAASSHDSIVYLCSLQNESDEPTCEKLQSHTAYVNCVRWSKDGRFLASASGDYNVKLWNGKMKEGDFFFSLIEMCEKCFNKKKFLY